MKKSEHLKKEADEQDSDLAYLGKMVKVFRERNLEHFEDNGYIPLLEYNDCIVHPFDGSKFTINTQTDKFGIIDFYPKANRVLIRKKNHWESHGLKWLKNNIITKDRL